MKYNKKETSAERLFRIVLGLLVYAVVWFCDQDFDAPYYQQIVASVLCSFVGTEDIVLSSCPDMCHFYSIHISQDKLRIA